MTAVPNSLAFIPLDARNVSMSARNFSRSVAMGKAYKPLRYKSISGMPVEKLSTDVAFMLFYR